MPSVRYPVPFMHSQMAAIRSPPPTMGPAAGASPTSPMPFSFYEKLRSYVLTQDQLWENNYVQLDQNGQWKVKSPDKPPQIQNSNDHVCVRCRQHFQMGPDTPLIPAPCSNHPGKFRQKGETGPKYWNCCDKTPKESQGCTTYRAHVHNDNILYGELQEHINGQVYPVDFKSAPVNPHAPRNVVALDVDMIYTKGGCELAKVTLVDENLNQILDWYVRPINSIIDYNTTFSGITENKVSQTPQARPQETLLHVQQELFRHIHADTIIIGHSLENDLKALRIIHSNVVDTAVVFKHNKYKRGLKDLARENLGMEIQKHCGEDPIATLRLMKYKVGLPLW